MKKRVIFLMSALILGLINNPTTITDLDRISLDDSIFINSNLISFANAQTEFNSEELGLGKPKISITPISGSPGTEVTISITEMPAPPSGLDPRIEFFVYLPFVPAIGSNVPYNCDKEYCIPIYTFDEINVGKVAPKTLTFTLFSTSNPKPIQINNLMQSVCDLKINGKTIERYGHTCNTKDQPVGEYEIKFAWGIQRTNSYDVIQTIPFTVTEGLPSPEEKPVNPDEVIINLYKDDLISEEEFDEELRKLGYNEEELRRVKGVMGKLEHQIGSYSPEQKEAIEKGIEAQESETTKPSGGCLIATATFGSELAPQVQFLREIRDNTVLSTASGTSFMTAFNSFYYSFSPAIADLERQNPLFKETVKVAITPLLSSLLLLQYVEIDSEAEMLGYGISVILLNIGMYFVTPALIIFKLKSKIS